MNIGIVAAMPLELNYLLEHLPPSEVQTISKNLFYQTTIGPHTLILVACGVGKTNATLYTQQLIDVYHPAFIINVGIAGGLINSLKTLDLIIGSHYNHHDVSRKQLQNLFPFTDTFYADKKLLALFKMNLPNAYIGGIASGEFFITNEDKRQAILNDFQPLCVDMETSAIAHTCFVNDTAFISLRCLSDMANSNADIDYKLTEKLASETAGKALLQILSLIPKKWQLL